MKRIFIICAALFMAASLNAQSQLPNDPAIKIGKLDNGLTYYIRHNDKPAQRAEFYLATNAGAINEGPGQDGLAHFLEHMCFNGLKNLPGKQMLEYLQSIGASFGGNINASTGVETTQYMLNNIPVVREGIIDTCLLVMHDYSHFVLLEEKEIDAERGVILEEKRTRNNASWRMFEQSAPYIYGDTKYAVTNVIGSEENLKTFKREAIADFYQTWYRPDKQAVIVVGDIDVDQIESKIKALFADIPAPVNPKEMEPIMIPSNEEPLVGVLTDPELTSNSIEVYWKRPAIPEQFNNTDAVFTLNLIDELFAMAMYERFSDLTAKPGSPFTAARLGSGKLAETTDVLEGRVAFANGNDVEAFKAFLEEVERVKRYGITEAELQRAKDEVLSTYEKAMSGADSRKNPQFIKPIIRSFFDNTPILDPTYEYELAKKACEDIAAGSVNQMVAQWITDNNMVVVLQGSSSYEHPDAQVLTDLVMASRKAEISAPASEEVSLQLLDPATLKGSKAKKTAKTVAGATEWTLKNGVKVVVLPTDFKKDEISMRLTLPGGKSLMSDDELRSFESNIWLIYMLKSSRVAQFSRSELTKILSGKYASASPFYDKANHGIASTATPKDLETALQLIYLAFTQPRFDPDEFQVAIDMINSLLPNIMNDPGFQLQSRVPGLLYGNNPRAFTLSPEVVEKASLENIEKVHRRLFRDAAGAVVTIVGNVDLDTLKPMVEKYIGSLPKGKKPLEKLDDGMRLSQGKCVDEFKTAMSTPKVTVRQIYNASVPATLENRITFNAVKYILNMVYTDTLREEEGGTYGASAYHEFVRFPYESIIFQVGFDTNVEQAKKLEELAKKGLRDLAEKGPSEEYFKRTIEFFRNQLPQQRIDNAYWMTVLQDYYEYGEDTDSTRDALIESLTKEKIAAAAAKLVDSGNLIEIEMSPEM